MGAGCLVTADRGEIPPFSRSTARFAPVPIEIFFFSGIDRTFLQRHLMAIDFLVLFFLLPLDVEHMAGK
jgi:hypothetical protein